MYVLSLTQPWASLIALGVKGFETRSWQTAYRGPLAIHAAKSYPKYCRATASAYPFYDALKAAGEDVNRLPRGAILCLCDLTAVEPTEAIVQLSQGLLRHEIEFGDYTPGRFAWRLLNVQRLAEPFLVSGRQRLWTLSPAQLTHLTARVISA